MPYEDKKTKMIEVVCAVCLLVLGFVIGYLRLQIVFTEGGLACTERYRKAGFSDDAVIRFCLREQEKRVCYRFSVHAAHAGE